MLKDDLLDKYIHNFFGYGNYKGSYWFIGMEEGTHGGVKEIADRLTFWNNHGNTELSDFAEMSIDTGTDKWIGDNACIQPTWRSLIRLYFASKNIIPTINDVRRYQGTQLGRFNSDNCALELMPLTCKSISKNTWFYHEWSELSYLGSKSDYVNKVTSYRINHIKNQISNYSPLLVVFYGKQYMNHWQEIADCSFSKIEKFQFGKKNGTNFCIAPHPMAVGLTNLEFEKAGYELANLAKQK